jgi:hypothetical protein
MVVVGAWIDRYYSCDHWNVKPIKLFKCRKKMILKRFITFIVIVAITLISLLVAEKISLLVVAENRSYYLALAVFIAGVGVFILPGLRRIDEDPPHKGILTILGKRQYKKRKTIYLDEGWRFLPFYPFLFDFVLVNVERKSFEVKTITRTPDGAETEITVTLSLRPIPEYLIQYEDNDGFEGVKKHLTGEIESLIREWAGSIQEGPMDWREIYQSKLEAASILIEGVARNQLPKIPEEAQEIPTYIWLRYFSRPRPEVNEVTTNEKKWAENDWEKVRLFEEKLNWRAQKLKEAVELCRKEIQKVRSDEGELNIFDLGIRLERLNVSNVKLIGEAAKVADQLAKEREERRAEILEMEHVKNLINELKEQFPEVPFQELRRIVQTERGKTPMKITELNLSPETMNVLSDILNLLKGGK